MLFKENQCSLHVRVAGSGVPLILIHPPLLTGETFRMQLLGLASERIQVVVPDLRGHGESAMTMADRDPANDRSMNYAVIAEDIIAMHHWMKLPPAVIGGYSTGGGIVPLLLRRAPELFCAGVIISGMPLVDIRDKTLQSEIRIARLLSGSVAGRAALLARTCILNSASAAMGLAMFRDGIKGNGRLIKDYYDAALMTDVTDDLPQIRQPILLMYGEKDAGFATYRDQFLDRLPYAELFSVPGLGHQLPSKGWRQINQMIRQWMITL